MKVIISFGSNTDSKNITVAEENLNGFVSAIRFSRIIETPPFVAPETACLEGRNFFNAILYGETELTYDELNARLKSTEYTMGRKDNDKAEGRVVIDLDILLHDTQLYRPDDWHREYNQLLLAEIEF